MTALVPFEVPRFEKIEKLAPNGQGTPLLFSSTPEALYIRPLNPVSGEPKAVLGLRDDEAFEVRDYQHHRDSLLVLLQSKTDASYTCVIYHIDDVKLAELRRIPVDLTSGPGKLDRSVVFTSSESGNWALLIRSSQFQPDQKASWQLTCIDTRSGAHQQYQVPLPFDADDLELLGAQIDDKGTVYTIVRSGIKLNSPFMRKFLLYSFQPATKDLREFDLSMDRMFLQEVSLHIHQNQLYAAGLYNSDPFMNAKSKGVVYLCLDTNGSTIVDKRIFPFKPEMVMQQRTGEERDDENISDLFLDRIVFFENDPYIVAEKRFHDQVCTTDPRTGIMNCTDQYHFQGISLENLRSRNPSITMGRLQIDYHKRSAHSGFQVFAVNGKMCVLYLDHPKNEGPNAERIMNNPSRSALRCNSFGPSGEMVSTKLLDEAESEFVFLAAVPGYATNRFIYILFTDGKQHRLGVIDASVF